MHGGQVAEATNYAVEKVERPSLMQRLEIRRDQLKQELETAEKAIELFEKNPDLNQSLDCIMKLNLNY